MINEIIKAISIQLHTEFGYQNHMEEIKQDLVEPCFFISCINPTTDLFLNKKYFRTNKFCIQYFPESELNAQNECNSVAERMIWCLEYITTLTKDQYRGTKMKYEVIDGVLNFFVNYDCFVYRVEDEEDCMDTIERSINVEDGE